MFLCFEVILLGTSFDLDVIIGLALPSHLCSPELALYVLSLRGQVFCYPVTSQSDDLPHTCGERSGTQASGVVLCVSSYVADLSLHLVCCPVDAHLGTFHHQPLTICLQGGAVGGGVTVLLSLNFSCNEVSCVCSVCGLYLVHRYMWGHVCMSVKGRGQPHVLFTVFFEIEPLLPWYLPHSLG